MMPQNLRDFYANWTRKANGIIGNELSDIYDKYQTLFVIYNNLYSQIRNVLIARGELVPKQSLDSQNSTSLVVRYLGGANILASFTAENNDVDIAAIVDVIDRELFHIKLKNGKSDLIILNNLRSANSADKALAILQVLYCVRCNLFHGSKEFVEYQRWLVEPLINILGTINNQLYAELDR